MKKFKSYIDYLYEEMFKITHINKEYINSINSVSNNCLVYSIKKK